MDPQPKTLRCVVFIVGVVVGCPGVADLWCGEPAPSIKPDAKIQALIHQVTQTIKKSEEALLAHTHLPDEPSKKALKALEDLIRKKPEVLVPQLKHYHDRAPTERDWGAVAGLIQHFNSRWAGQMRNGCVPLLEAVDYETRSGAFAWLRGLDEESRGSGEHNVGKYRPFLRVNPDSPPPGLVTYVYDLSPSQAMLLMGEIHTGKVEKPPRDLLWSDHVVTTVAWRLRNSFVQNEDVPTVVKELEKLSKDKRWFVRRYVIEMMRREPGLKVMDVITRLENDTHPLVRNGVTLFNQITSGTPPRRR